MYYILMINFVNIKYNQCRNNHWRKIMQVLHPQDVNNGCQTISLTDPSHGGWTKGHNLHGFWSECILTESNSAGGFTAWSKGKRWFETEKERDDYIKSRTKIKI